MSNKIVEYKINKFNGGISDDPRASSANSFVKASHFDIFSFPNRLVPYRSLEADTNDGSTSTGMKQYFVKDYLYSSTSAILYGLGQNGAGQTKIVYKADATSGNWTLPANSEGNALVLNGCFVEYKDYLWGFQGVNQVWKWGLLSGTPSITNAVTTVASTITSVANGIIASDGNLYIAYNNVVVRVSTTGTVTDLAKTVPSNYKITSLCNFGKYVAIGCAPVSTFNGMSKVFLWDGSSDLFAESIDWGEGELRILETIEGMLVGVTDRYLNNSVGAGRGSMIIQVYSGGTPQLVKEVFTQKIVGKTMPQSKVVKNNRLFWAAKIMTNLSGTEYDEGIWSFGRKNASSPFALNLDITDENINTSGIQAIGSAANFFFITHSADGSIDKTDDTANYNFDSIYESQIFDFGDPHLVKKLLGISVATQWTTTIGTITTKYKINGDTSWTTIGTFINSGLSPVFQENYVNIESTGIDFASGKEYKFRIESTDGGEITGFKCRAQILDGLISGTNV